MTTSQLPSATPADHVRDLADPATVAAHLLHLLQELQAENEAYVYPCMLAGVIGGMLREITGEQTELGRLAAEMRAEAKARAAATA
jgi:hypothetical protein